jgi:transposase
VDELGLTRLIGTRNTSATPLFYFGDFFMKLFSLGIDISKATFNVALLLDNGKLRHKVFANNPNGFQQLSAWLLKHKAPAVHACMEATGTYGEALATYLHQAGHRVSVLNPVIIKGFAISQMSRSKTDKSDATLIARYCEQNHPPAWTPLAPEISELQALVRRLEALLEMLQQERNRLSAGVNSVTVKENIQEHIDYLKEQIDNTEKLIREHIDQHPRLKEQRELLTSIPGIGETTAARFLAEIIDINHYDSARQVAAFAGLIPKHEESGTSVKSQARLSKVGNSRLRKAFYFPAIVARRYNPIIKEQSQRLEKRGKCAMVIIGAAMRKLVHLAYGVLKTGKPFDPLYGKTA